MLTAYKPTITVDTYDKSKHYELLCGWWNSYKFHPPADWFLPKTGIVINIDHIPTAAGFNFYVTGSPVAWVEFIVADKGALKEDKDLALNSLYEALTADAKRRGVRILFSSLEHSKLIDRAVLNGFQVTDKNMTNLIKVVE